MAAQTSTSQKQGGSDQSVSAEQPSLVESKRTEGASTVITRTESGEEVTESRTGGTTSRTVQRERIGCTLSFSIKITNTPPPKALDS